MGPLPGRGLISRLERLGCVEPASYGPRSRWWRWPARSTVRLPTIGPSTASPWSRSASRCAAGSGRKGASRPSRIGQLLVCRVDLGHLAGRQPGRRLIRSGEVRMMLPSKSAPGRLDRSGAGVGGNAQDGMGVAARHGESLAGASAMPEASSWRPYACPRSMRRHLT